MQFKKGDTLSYQIETRESGFKYLLDRPQSKNSTLEWRKFPIIAVNEKNQSYFVQIDDDVIGWIISKFHIKHHGVDEKLLGKRFWEIKECLSSVELNQSKLETPVPPVAIPPQSQPIHKEQEKNIENKAVESAAAEEKDKDIIVNNATTAESLPEIAVAVVAQDSTIKKTRKVAFSAIDAAKAAKL